MRKNALAFNLLDTMEAGWAILDNQFRITEFNLKFQSFNPTHSRVQNRLITEILPEIIGLEDILNSMTAGDRPGFSLAHIAREVIPGNDSYFNLILTASQNSEQPFLIVLLEQTEHAVILQKIQQQSFEIKLMRHLLNERQAAVAAGMIGFSEPVKILKSTIDKLARIPSSTILIQGETGTGKSLVARMIHLATDDSDRPFVEFNCAAVPESLLESELFGHEKGAFTHAVAQKKGLLEEADGGTLFLDEIGDIHSNVQAKLLTVLDSRKFRRLGSTKEISTQFRLIAATNRDLQAMVKEGSFREDLYYRIQVITLSCPPLRDLGKDVIHIAFHFVQVYAKEFGKSVAGLTSEAKTKLMNYSWPGNVRELRNVIERAMIFVESTMLDSADIQLQSGGNAPVSRLPALLNDGLSFAELEKQLLKQALERADGNQSRAARLLQMSRDSFRYRLEKYNLLG